jgi:predicted RNA-binding Zn-ribbon protein involved in translation (DUF1610 family)
VCKPEIDYDLYRRHVRRLNRLEPDPWPVCRSCRVPYDPAGQHWLFRRRCDSCGTARMEAIVARMLKTRSSAVATRCLRALERGPYEGTRRRQPAPALKTWPLCKGCNGALDPQEADVHFPELCSTCGINRTYATIAPLVERFGADGAMIKLQALARIV